MTLGLILLGMVCCVVALLIGPSFLRRASVPSGRQDFDIAVYKDQLSEVDRDVERGHISAQETTIIRLEIQRRLLAAADGAEPIKSSTISHTGASPILVVLTLLIPVLSGTLYLQLGSPGTPGFPYTERDDLSNMAQGAAGMDEMLAGLKARLAANPNDSEGWAMLGRSYQVLERYSESADAFLKLYEMTGSARAMSEYAEALILANDTIVNAEIQAILEQVLLADPIDPKARFYLGLGVAQQGNLAGAVQVWTDVIHLSPSDAGWLPAVRAQIDEAAKSAGINLASVSPSPEAIQLAIAAGIDHTAPMSASPITPGPTAEDIENAASMSADDQLEMIRSMVQRLADRLQEDPEDPEGWARLIQAYGVLGDTEKVEQARKDAAPYLR